MYIDKHAIEAEKDPLAPLDPHILRLLKQDARLFLDALESDEYAQ